LCIFLLNILVLSHQHCEFCQKLNNCYITFTAFISTLQLHNALWQTLAGRNATPDQFLLKVTGCYKNFVISAVLFLKKCSLTKAKTSLSMSFECFAVCIIQCKLFLWWKRLFLTSAKDQILWSRNGSAFTSTYFSTRR